MTREATAYHEAGHAIQHARNYAPLWLRSVLVKPASIGASFAPWLVILGILMSANGLFTAGIILFSAAVAFQVVTLPVEFDATARAKKLAVSSGIVSERERLGMDKVLNAAALTYVAAALTSLMQLLYFISRRD